MKDAYTLSEEIKRINRGFLINIWLVLFVFSIILPIPLIWFDIIRGNVNPEFLQLNYQAARWWFIMSVQAFFVACYFGIIMWKKWAVFGYFIGELLILLSFIVSLGLPGAKSYYARILIAIMLYFGVRKRWQLFK